MQKLAQCHPHPLKALAKLSPHTLQYVVPKSCKRLARYALIMYNTAGRQGAKEEADDLERGLSYVGFNVTSEEWSTTSQLLKTIQARLMEQADRSSIVFISIMSHGHHGVLRGSHGSEMSVNDVLGLASGIIPIHIPVVSITLLLPTMFHNENRVIENDWLIHFFSLM